MKNLIAAKDAAGQATQVHAGTQIGTSYKYPDNADGLPHIHVSFGQEGQGDTQGYSDFDPLHGGFDPTPYLGADVDWARRAHEKDPAHFNNGEHRDWTLDQWCGGPAFNTSGGNPGGSGSNTATVTTINNPDTYSCGQSGYVGFEDFPDSTNLSSGTVAGVHFTTTNGFTWLVGDFATHNYNGKYPNGGYTSHGTHWAWLGPNQGSGRIDFPKGPASYFSLLTSLNLTDVVLEAYNSGNVRIATAGPPPLNYGTGHMARVNNEL